MRFVHSLNTNPIFNNNNHIIPQFYRLVGSIIYSAMSVCWVQYHGHDIILHTDSKGKDLLDFIPYNEIHTTRDDIPKDIHPAFFAAGKMYAMSNEPLNSIHIDNDVFLKKPIVYDLIENSKYELLIQQTEDGEIYDEFAGHIYKKDPDFFNQQGLDINDHRAYNTGILNFRSQSLKDEFIEKYKKIVRHYSKICDNELSTSKKCIPDLFAEQMNIYQTSKNYNVLGLLDGTQIDDFAYDIGYQHVLTYVKFTKMDMVMDMLSKINPDMYNKTLERVQQIMKAKGYDHYNIKTVGDIGYIQVG